MQSLNADSDADGRDAEPTETNEFSSQDFRVLNFIADLPVRVDGILNRRGVETPSGRGRVVFILAEFQVLDRATAARNEQGESAHELYKQRQHGRVRERLLRAPGKRSQS